jgi:type IV pilus biogenesis protein CpaD/CtpE
MGDGGVQVEYVLVASSTGQCMQTHDDTVSQQIFSKKAYNIIEL